MILSYGDLKYLGVSCGFRDFPVMISMDAYLMIFMFAMILCGLFHFVAFGSMSAG